MIRLGSGRRTLPSISRARAYAARSEQPSWNSGTSISCRAIFIDGLSEAIGS